MARELLPQGELGRLTAADEAYDAKHAINLGEDAWLLSAAAGIERENYTSAWINDKVRKKLAGIEEITYKEDPNYRFEDDEANFGYDPMRMLEAGSAEEAAAMRQQIDQEMAQLRLISSSAWGTAGQVMGGIFQPHVAATLPLAQTSVIGAMVLEAGLEAGSELMLHNMQQTRTLEESFWNVGLTTVGVGILGGAANLGKLRRPPKDAIDEINSGWVPGGAPPDSMGAARVREDDMTAADDRLVGGAAADFFSFGQMAALSRSLSDTARNIAAKMADNPLFTRGNAAGKTRGVSVESLHEAAMGRVVIATDKAAQMQKQSGMTVNEFEHEIGVAMSSGDRHANPKVQEAAEMYRAEVIEPIQEAASRLGLIETEEGIKVKIDMIEEDVQRLLDEGAGPGSTARIRELEAQKAAIITKHDRRTRALQARLKKIETKIAEARAPLEEGGAARKAPKRMIDQQNKAKRAISDHMKMIEKEAAPSTKELKQIKARNKRLKKYRENIKKLKAKQESGTLYAESYFPRVYDHEKIYSSWNSLRALLKSHFSADKKLTGKMDDLEIDEMVTNTMHNMVNGRASHLGKDGKPSALRARSLSLLDKQLEPFLEKRASQIMLKHAQAMQPYLMMREAFGGASLEDMIAKIEDDYKKLAEPKERPEGEYYDPKEVKDVELTAKQREKLNKQMNDDIARIRVMHDRLMHQVQRATNPGSKAVKALQWAKLWNLTTLLGGVVLSSLPDIARPIAHYGLRSFGKALGKSMAQAFSGKNSLSSIQVKRTGAALQRTLNERAMQLSDSLQPDSKWMMKGQKIWSKATGFDWYTDVMESVATHAAMDWVVRQAAKVASEKPLSKSATKQLARMGIRQEDLVEIYSESMGTMGAQDSVLKYMNTMAWKNMDLAKNVEAAIGSDVRRTIIRIGVGEKPAVMDEHMWSWLFQFQSFAMSAQNKIMLAGLQNMSRHTIEGLAAMMVIGAGVGAGKSWLRGNDPSDWSTEQWVFEGIDRSGMVGILREPMNALRFAAAVHGWTDGVPSRYAGKGVERAFMSPSASTAGLAGMAIYDMMGGDYEAAADKVSRATPFINNTWHIREALTQMGDS